MIFSYCIIYTCILFCCTFVIINRYVAVKNHLMWWRQLWQFATSAPVFSSPSVVSSVSSSQHSVLVGSHDHRLYCLSPDSGSVRWTCQLDSELYATPSPFVASNTAGKRPTRGQKVEGVHTARFGVGSGYP